MVDARGWLSEWGSDRERGVHFTEVRRSWSVMLMVVVILAGGCEGAESAEAEGDGEPSGRPTEEVEIAGREFELELALNSDTRHRGLSDRESIAEDGGMLFAFPEPGRLAFVMRDCLVPIDIIFLDSAGVVLNTHAMEVEPYGRAEVFLTRYRSEGEAQFAIELRGGMVEELGVERGEEIALPLERLKRQAR